MNEQPVDEVTLGGARLSLIAGEQLIRHVVAEAASDMAGYVCVANVHQVTEAWRSDAFRRTLNRARWVSTDSRILEITMAAFGHRYPSVVTYGASLLEDFCAAATESGLQVGLLGGSSTVVNDLAYALRQKFPRLQLSMVNAPGYGSAELLANDQVIEAINASGVRILLVGLGCPKQETWMRLVSDRTTCMMVGIGAAFDFCAGHKTASPGWVRRAGLDWMWRMLSEPHRLWKRYLIGNSLFLARVVPALLFRFLTRRKKSPTNILQLD